MNLCDEAVVHNSIVRTIMYGWGHLQLCKFKGCKLRGSNILTLHFLVNLQVLSSCLWSYVIPIVLASLTRQHQAKVAVF